MDNKWKSLEARGYTRPKSRVENDQRARDAHHKITPQLGRVR